MYISLFLPFFIFPVNLCPLCPVLLSLLFLCISMLLNLILSQSLFLYKNTEIRKFSPFCLPPLSALLPFTPLPFLFFHPFQSPLKFPLVPLHSHPASARFLLFLFMPVFLNPLNSHSSPSLCSFFSPPLSVHHLFSCLEFSHSSTLPHTPVYAFSLKSPTYRIPFFRFLLTPATKKALTRFFTQLRFSLLPAPPDLSRGPQYVPNPPPYPYTPSRNADRIPP